MQANNLTQETQTRVAELIESHGYISASPHRGKYRVRLEVRTSRAAAEELRALTGVGFVTRMPDGNGWRDSRWVINGDRAAEVVSQVVSLLNTRRERAEALLRLVDAYSTHRPPAQGKAALVVLRRGSPAVRESARQSVAAVLNRRGRLTVRRAPRRTASMPIIQVDTTETEARQLREWTGRGSVFPVRRKRHWRWEAVAQAARAVLETVLDDLDDEKRARARAMVELSRLQAIPATDPATGRPARHRPEEQDRLAAVIRSETRRTSSPAVAA